MNGFWGKRIKDIEPYTPGEQPRDRTYIKLNTNENPYPPSPRTIEAMKNAAGENLRLYPDPTCLELRSAIADYYGLEPENVFVGNGSDEVIAMCFAAFLMTGRPCVSLTFLTASTPYTPGCSALHMTLFRLMKASGS